MYLSTTPGPDDAPSHLRSQWQEEEQAMNAYEGLAEFIAVGRVDEEKCEADWSAMRADSEYVEWGRR